MVNDEYSAEFTAEPRVPKVIVSEPVYGTMNHPVLGGTEMAAKYYVKTLPCMVCHERSDVEMTADEFRDYKRGLNLAVVFPHYNANQRELLITGTHAECWDKMFGADDEENEEVVPQYKYDGDAGPRYGDGDE